MRLIDAIPVLDNSRIAFVGAGGKTTAMFRLARQAQESGMRSVLLSATTHLTEEQLSWADRQITLNTKTDVLKLYDAPLEGVNLLTGALGSDQRSQGLSLDLITEVEKLAQEHQAALLIESDGSRRKPLKAPANHEPVIPSWVKRVVVVAGLSGLGQELREEFVHRSQIFKELSGLNIGEVLHVDALARVLMADKGGLKGIPPNAKRTMLLNQCDTPALAAQGKQISNRLLSVYDQVILSKLYEPSGEEVLAVHRPIAGIILAAGGSTRLGQPKQLLDWQGKTFVEAITETVLAAGLWPVVVVTGADQQEVESVLNGKSIHILHNPDWKEGQASSVRTAVEFISTEWKDVFGAMFFLVDQPQIPVALARSLVDVYSGTLSPIVAPLVDDRRGNPVLFDRVTFKELMRLQGDAGGRQVFSRFSVHYVPWLDSKAGLDVDTMEDYRRLLDED